MPAHALFVKGWGSPKRPLWSKMDGSAPLGVIGRAMKILSILQRGLIFGYAR